MRTKKIIVGSKSQPAFRLTKLCRNILFELIDEAVYKWPLVQRIRNEARERALAGLSD
jgi:hypothetical protein